MAMGVDEGPDGRARCWWCLGASEYVDYHDHVWGRPLHGERELFEMLTLESFQSGLSWLTILRKRDGFSHAFDGWDLDRIAAYGEADRERLLADAAIVRNRAKIEATIANARATLGLHGRGETLDQLLWSFASAHSDRPAPVRGEELEPATAESKAMARELSSGAGSASSVRRPPTR
jgi:DNA-3-methyladenine glycosylase I